MARMERSLGLGVLIAGLACCLLAVAPPVAQSKKSAKQSASLEKAGETASASVQEVLGGLRQLLAGYNAIIQGEAKDPHAAHKKLVNDLKSTTKSIESARKDVDALNKEADRFFKAWEKDLATISSDSVREKGENRLDLARKRYASMSDTLTQAREEFRPVVQNLNDQIVFLGRDLSPAAIADLQDEAEALNLQASEATVKVKALLQSAGETQHEAEAAIDEEEG